MFVASLQRELALAKHRGSELLNPLLLYLFIVCLFPMAIEPKSSLLLTIAPGIIWVAVLLASVSGLENLFRADYDDGVIEQWFLVPSGAFTIIAAKLLSHWLLSALPAVLLTPVLGYILGLSGTPLSVLALGVLLGTPVLVMLGAIAAALTVAVKRGGALLSLLLLPLFVPVLIFGAQSVTAAADGLVVQGQLYLLAAFSVLSMTLGVFGVYGALKLAVEN